MGLILVDLHSRHPFPGRFNLCGCREHSLCPHKLPAVVCAGCLSERSLVLALIIPSLILGGFLAIALYKVARIRFGPPVSGKIIGEEAEAIDRLDPGGYVPFQGEYWKTEAYSLVEPKETVVIIGKKGAALKVKRKA
ncbi:MAG: hypothetical protein MUO26_03685 [Methanotrichaceae archaeon]|nr:hypothetical protein [Methanotrichaceae archaeon]